MRRQDSQARDKTGARGRRDFADAAIRGQRRKRRRADQLQVLLPDVDLAAPYRDKRGLSATYVAATWKVSNMICTIFSRIPLGLNGGSVRRTAFLFGDTRSSL